MSLAAILHLFAMVRGVSTRQWGHPEDLPAWLRWLHSAELLRWQRRAAFGKAAWNG